MKDSVYSNLEIYLNITKDSFKKSQRFLNLNRKRIPGNEKGFILKFDPDHKAFKQSLITIVFAGMYMEALFHIVGSIRVGKSKWRKKYDGEKYECKLCALGIYDLELIGLCRRFREARNEIMHEKAFSKQKIRFAHEEAINAINVIKQVSKLLKNKT